MPSDKQRYGTWTERLAEEFLRRKGYHILDRHVTSRYGEIDIIALDGETIVAVEVKARRNEAFGKAIEAMDVKKMERLRHTVEELIGQRGWTKRDVRCDVVTFDELPTGMIQVGHIVGVG